MPLPGYHIRSLLGLFWYHHHCHQVPAPFCIPLPFTTCYRFTIGWEVHSGGSFLGVHIWAGDPGPPFTTDTTVDTAVFYIPPLSDTTILFCSDLTIPPTISTILFVGTVWRLHLPAWVPPQVTTACHACLGCSAPLFCTWNYRFYRFLPAWEVDAALLDAVLGDAPAILHRSTTCLQPAVFLE